MTAKFPVLIAALALTACQRRDLRESDTRTKTDADTAAYKAGKVAHEVAARSEKAAKEAGVKLKEAAKSAKEGWKDAPSERNQNK